MRAVDGGFELKYTQPLSQETAENLADRYRVKQWRYVPTPAYGGPKVDKEPLTARSAPRRQEGAAQHRRPQGRPRRGAPETAMTGVIRLQDPCSKVRYRNIWIEPLD